MSPTTETPPTASTATAAALTDAAPLPEGVREGNENLVSLTGPAGAKVRALVAREQQGEYLRVAISGGGCNGLSYKLRFAAAPRKGDILVRTAGIPVIVDPKTALYLKGTVIDYSSKLIAGGFKFANPNAKASCSCGESFSV
ncbi:Iron-sulfur cluster assembly accessory protein [Opitutaceae bacterium TAV1]|nr:Iron-sulfur cluster assembly accessory protein [Opitutaceae bacterium TAV1]